jgi:DNA-binding response OmpR family regulator
MDLEINTVDKTVKRGTEIITLSPREYKLLEYLMFRQGEVVSRAELEEHIYDERVNPMSNVVDSTICNLRKKLNQNDQPNLIHTLRGMGYVLKPSNP